MFTKIYIMFDKSYHIILNGYSIFDIQALKKKIVARRIYACLNKYVIYMLVY